MFTALMISPISTGFSYNHTCIYRASPQNGPGNGRDGPRHAGAALPGILSMRPPRRISHRRLGHHRICLNIVPPEPLIRNNFTTSSAKISSSRAHLHGHNITTSSPSESPKSPTPTPQRINANLYAFCIPQYNLRQYNFQHYNILQYNPPQYYLLLSNTHTIHKQTFMHSTIIPATVMRFTSYMQTFILLTVLRFPQ